MKKFFAIGIIIPILLMTSCSIFYGTVSIIYDPNGAVEGSVPQNQNVYSIYERVVVSDLDFLVDIDNGNFLCWNTKSDGSGVNYNPNDVIEITKELTDHGIIKLYAIFGYKITYNNMGITNIPDLSDDNLYSKNSSVTLIGYKPNLGDAYYSDAGNKFEGWNSKETLDGETYLPGETINLKENTTLYAIWSIN